MAARVARRLAAAIALAALALACDETSSPTTSPELTPQLDHRPGHGTPGGKQKELDPRAIFEYPVNDAGLQIISDHRSPSTDGTSFVYDDGDCGVTAKIFASGSGDAVMDPDGKKITGPDRDRCGDPRFITVIYDQPVTGDPPLDPVENFGTFHNMNDLWNLPVGQEVEGQAGLNTPRCSVLRFKPDEYPGSDRVLIFRENDTTWRVRTKPLPDNKAWCGNEGRFFNMSFVLTVRAKP